MWKRFRAEIVLTDDIMTNIPSDISEKIERKSQNRILELQYYENSLIIQRHRDASAAAGHKKQC